MEIYEGQGKWSVIFNQFQPCCERKKAAFGEEKILFHQDNECEHTCVMATAKFHELRFELLPFSPYSPDLAPSDYFPFPNMKKWIGGKKCGLNGEMIAETNAYFQALKKSCFLDGI